jgi:branched-chain amino acid transport system permease protein
VRVKLAVAGVVAIAVVVAPFVVSDHRTHQLTLVGAYFVAILGLDLLGLSGQVSLGQGAFMAIGGYTAAILCAHHGYGPPFALLIGIVAAAAAGLVASFGGRRGLPVVTIALALALPSILGRIDSSVIFGPVKHGYLLTWLVAGVLFVVAWLLVESSLARVLRALRDNDLAASASGVNAVAYRALASTLAAAYAGAGGALVALVAGHADPTTFPFELSLLLFAAAVVGGLWGALAGAIAVELLVGHHPALVLGVALIAALVVRRTVRRT